MTRRPRPQVPGWDAAAARAERAAKFGGNPAPPAPIGGILAQITTDCATCGGGIERHVHTVINRKGHWIHAGCAPGADDE